MSLRSTFTLLASLWIALPAQAQPSGTAASIETTSNAEAFISNLNFFVNSQPGDRFGEAVDLEGDRAVVGAWNVGYQGQPTSANGNGAVYVFAFVDGSWTLEATLSVPGNGIRFGRSVDLDGDRLLVGAPRARQGVFQTGAAYLYRRGASGWRLEATLLPGDIIDTAGFGESVALDGGRALLTMPNVSIPNSPGWSGYVYAFEQTGTTWAQTQRLRPSSAESFARSVALDGDRALVGNLSGTGPDGAYAYAYVGGMWQQEQLIAPTGVGTNLRFGDAVALDGARAVIGAPSLTSSAGSAFVYEHDGAAWTQTARLETAASFFQNEFATAVALDGNRAAATGTAFDLIDGTWQPVAVLGPNSRHALALSEGRVLAGLSNGQTSVYAAGSELSLSSGAFSDVAPGQERERRIQLENRTFSRLALSSVTLTGDPAFSLVNPPDANGRVLLGGERIEHRVRFGSSVVGVHAASLVYTHDGPSSPDTVHLRGEVTGPQLEVNDQQTSFGSQQLNQPLSRTVRVRNTGALPLTISSMRGSEPAFVAQALPEPSSRHKSFSCRSSSRRPRRGCTRTRYWFSTMALRAPTRCFSRASEEEPSFAGRIQERRSLKPLWETRGTQYALTCQTPAFFRSGSTGSNPTIRPSSPPSTRSASSRGKTPG